MQLAQVKQDQYLYGQVVKGKQLGRTIGFPTANVELETGISLENGVYGVYVFHNNKKHIGVMNVGKRPTFDDGEHKTYEVHILDFQDDIYDEIITLDIKFYIRSEQKFQHIQDLIHQLHRDVFNARKKFRLV